MKAVILAAGIGSRLKELTKGRPKCLLEVGGETLLAREIRLLLDVGLSSEDIYVVAGYRAEQLKNIAPNIVYNAEYQTKDNSYSLRLALQSIPEDDVLVLDSDLFFEREILIEILEDPHANVLLSKRSSDLEESTGIVTADSGRVLAIGKNYKNTGYVYISIFKVSKNTIPILRMKLSEETAEKTWYTLAISNICKDHFFFNRVTKQKWHEIDFKDDYYQTIQLFGLDNFNKEVFI